MIHNASVNNSSIFKAKENGRTTLILSCVRWLQSDFLDFYVSYLREIPECLSVISMLASGSVPSSAFAEVTPNGVNANRMFLIPKKRCSAACRVRSF